MGGTSNLNSTTANGSDTGSSNSAILGIIAAVVMAVVALLAIVPSVFSPSSLCPHTDDQDACAIGEDNTPEYRWILRVEKTPRTAQLVSKLSTLQVQPKTTNFPRYPNRSHPCRRTSPTGQKSGTFLKFFSFNYQLLKLF